MDEGEDASLALDTIHLWKTDLDVTPPELSSLEQTLDPGERERGNRFRFPRHRRRFVAARGVLRDVLSTYVALAPEDLQFSYSEAGKPELAAEQNPDGVRFNLSHAHELALIAISRGAPVGVDLEHRRDLDDVFGLAQRHFSPIELAELSALPRELWEAGFFACWTRKEAYVKATGEGLSTALDRFAVSVSPHEPPQLLHVDGDPERARGWRLMDVSPAPDYVATLAVQREDWQLVTHHWRPVGIR